MEYLKSCNTNAQSIGGFEAVSYQAFSVKQTPGPTRSNERSPSEDIRSVEAELRQLQNLVVQDATRPWLWLFRAVALDKATEKPKDLPQVDGFQLQLEQSGVMKASDLARPALRSANPNTPTAGTSSPLTTTAARGSLAGAGTQQQSSDSLILYELFTASIVALVSFHLIKNHNAVALNYRTFLTKFTPADDDGAGDGASATKYCSLHLSNLNVYWASNGTLLVSNVSVEQPNIHCLDETTSLDASKQLIGKCIRIAPSGALAKLVSFDDPLDRAGDEPDRLPPRKRARPGSAVHSMEKWKLAVTRWLSSKGYSTSSLEKRTAWARIHVPHLNRFPSTQSRDLLWPRAMCFYYDDADQPHYDSILNGDSMDPLGWFSTSYSSGFVDPFDAVQRWFFGQAERDKAVEARRQALKAEEEAAKAKDDVPGALFPSSPLNLRNNAYGDHQAASGVYPTPPDGVAPGTAVSHGDTPSISGATANTILVPGGTNPGINLSVPQDNPSSDAANPGATSPDFAMDFENFHSNTANDPFDDMDEDDDFGANGVTDADFNFFDDPDSGEVEMTDAPVIQANPQPSSLPSTDADHSSRTIHIDEKSLADSIGAPERSHAIAPEPRVNGVEATNRSNGKGDKELSAADTGGHDASSSSLPASIAIKQEPVSTPNVAPIQEPVHVAPTPRSKPKPKRNVPHRDSIFNPIDFDEKMTLSDEKYYKGRFAFPQDKPQARSATVAAPAKLPASLKDAPLLASMRYAVGIVTKSGMGRIQLLPDDDDDSESTSSVASSFSEDDDLTSIPPEPLSAGLIASSKRKLPTDGNRTPLSVTSFADSLAGDALELATFHLDEGNLSLLDPSPWDWSLIDMPPPAEVQVTTGRYSIPSFSPMLSSLPNTPTSQPDVAFDIPEEKLLSKTDTIFVAQVVTDQIVSATLDLFHEDSQCSHDLAPRIPQTDIQRTVKSIFTKAVECNVSALISIADTYPEVSSSGKGTQRVTPRRPNEAPALPGSHVIPLQPPMVRLKRADNLWEFLPPTLAFWEALSLAPCGAPKNVASLCIYPHSESMKPCLHNFLTNLRLAYEGCKLGNHVPAELQPDYAEGLIPWVPAQPHSVRAAFSSLRDTCVALGKALASKHAQMRDNDDTPRVDAFVIYMINPFKESSAMWELCSAFWSLFQAYGPGPSGRRNVPAKPDVVLQIVPVDAIASFDVPVILNSSAYVNLAREVYDRCPPSAPADDKSPLSIYSAPSFQLEEAIPRRIDFRNLPDPPQDLLRENSYIHVGYAISLDGSWVTCAWSDSPGKSRTVTSYHLGTRAFREIAKEIWQTTIDVCQVRKVTWRLCIAKCGAMDREELEVWHYFSTLQTPVNFFITLLTVNPNPPLKFTPASSASASVSASANPQPGANTPASTPKAGVSPDPHSLTPAPTPAADSAADPSNDPDTRLVDVTDETWGVILAHRLHNTNSTVEFRPCLISGLLVKRGQSQQATTPIPSTPDPEQGPIVVGVNILWISTMSPRSPTSPFPTASDGISPGGQVSPSPIPERERMSLMWTPTPQHRSTAESVLRELLVQFRNLGTLARLKGIRGCRMGTVPWHVAVAKRGVERLTKCFPYN